MFYTWITRIITLLSIPKQVVVLSVRGHNKQKRDDLRQFGLAAVTNTDLQIPLVWEMYDGNKNDKTEFADFTKLIKQEVSKYGTNPEDITLVFDAGSNSEKEFAALNMQVICAHSLAGHKHLYEIGLERYDKVEIMPEKEKLAYRIEKRKNNVATQTRHHSGRYI